MNDNHNRTLNTQNNLLLNTLYDFYEKNENLHKLMNIVNGESKISLRIVDWFVTNYAKKHYIVYDNRFKVYNDYKLKLKAYSKKRFDPFCRWDRIYIPYKSLSSTTTTTTNTTTAASACTPPPPPPSHDNDDHHLREQTKMETTIGQLNFFKWAIENDILGYIHTNYETIEEDMNLRNSSSKRKTVKESQHNIQTKQSPRNNSNSSSNTNTNSNSNYSDVAEVACAKTRKKREELSVSACKCIKKEKVKIVVTFS